MNCQDTTDEILLTPLNNYDEVIDIQYNKKLSDDDNLDSSRIYEILFETESDIDKILPKEVTYLNKRTDIPVKAKTIATGNAIDNGVYLRLS